MALGPSNSEEEENNVIQISSKACQLTRRPQPLNDQELEKIKDYQLHGIIA